MVNNQLAKSNKEAPLIRFLAHGFSVVFHPIFIPLYVIWFLIIFHPSYFSGFGDYEKSKLLFTTALNTLFFPLISVLLMKGLGFIQSVFLYSRQDRIAPYLAVMIFYFWTAWVFFKFEPQLPTLLPSFMTGVMLTSVAALLSNIYFKISMHAMGIGGLLGVFLVINQSHTMLMTWPLSAALLIGGIVCTSRLLVSDHRPGDIYRGLVTGMVCQFIAALIII